MMAMMSGTSEIIESANELSYEFKRDVNAQERNPGKVARKYSIEEDINKLFEAIDIRNSRKSIGQQGAGDAFGKSAMKRPMRVGYSQASGIGISESVSLKQALRGLCISQASEMAAVKKRLSKPSGVADPGALKRLHQAMVVETKESSVRPYYLDKGKLVEVSLVPERKTLDLSDKAAESNCPPHAEQQNHNAGSSAMSSNELAQKTKLAEDLPIDKVATSSASVGSQCSEAGSELSKRLKLPHSLNGTSTNHKLLVLDEIVSMPNEVPISSFGREKQLEGKLDSPSSSSTHNAGKRPTKPVTRTPHLIRPVFRSKSFNKKFMQYSTPSLGGFSQQSSRMNNVLDCSSSHMGCQTPTAVVKDGKEDEVSPVSSSGNTSVEVNSYPVESAVSKLVPNSLCNGKTRSIVAKAEKESRSREKGEISQSSKSSIGDYSSTTSFSEESQLSGANRSGCRPHMSKDVRWGAINCVKKRHGSLGLRNFKLLRKLGGGDIGSVYLSELVGTNCLFAVKVMDNEFLASRRKTARALTEKEILEMLDHPFLPTLFANFTTDKYSCLVMEYCPGGDLHVLRQKQLSRSFTEQAARFYVAEVLLALEYLHMLGVVYRDLKPENVLVREDGHIMLTDFDLSLRCAVNPTLFKSSSPIVNPPKKMSSHCSESSCIDPFCLNPSWQVSCFTPRFLTAAAKSRKLKSEVATQVSPLPQLVVEPTSARSNSFVGTHEYLAPEIIKGEGHGSAVDWWTLGIFLYELLYGKTPFKGPGNEDTLANVISQCLKFPEIPMVGSHARDLMRRLLQKEPENRLGSERGAAEIKQHPFFDGLNMALIRCATPPELPKDLGYTSSEMLQQNKKNSMCRRESQNTGDDLLFEMF